jgi:hypothetical protein
MAAGQPHFGQHALVVGLPHKPIQRREGAGRQQFQVTHRALRDLNRRQGVSVFL